MRGQYKFTEQDRREFYYGLLQLIKSPLEGVELSDTHLTLCNCEDALEELGYEREDCEIDGWEGDFWWYFYKDGAPTIRIGGDAYTARLDLSFRDADYGEEIDGGSLENVMREKWSKYFLI